MGAKVECFAGDDNGFIQVLYCPNLLVPSEKVFTEVAQSARPERVSFRAKFNHFSDKDNGLVKGFIKILHFPDVIVPTNCKVNQKTRSIKVPLWARLNRFLAEGNGYVEVLQRPKLVTLNGELNHEVVQRG